MSACQPKEDRTVPHEGKWGIYSLDLATEDIALIYSTNDTISSSDLKQNAAGDRFVFAQKPAGARDSAYEIYTIGVNGGNPTRLTTNTYMDVYPIWSPDGSRIAYLSWPSTYLSVWLMNANGTNQRLLYGGSDHSGDIDWTGSKIVYTFGSRLWTMDSSGTGSDTLTYPAGAGTWGTVNLPIGDYDPRWNPAGTKVVFERLEDPNVEHGAYNFFTVNADGSSETRLTSTSCAQGLAAWSHSGTRIIYLVSAIAGAGKYDMYMMNADGSDNRDITPSYFPPGFLCYASIFSNDDSKIYFIGMWY